MMTHFEFLTLSALFSLLISIIASAEGKLGPQHYLS